MYKKVYNTVDFMEMQTEAKMISEYTLLKRLTLSSVGNDMKQMEVPSIECTLIQLFLKSVSFKLNVCLLYDPTFPICRKIFKEIAFLFADFVFTFLVIFCITKSFSIFFLNLFIA